MYNKIKAYFETKRKKEFDESRSSGLCASYFEISLGSEQFDQLTREIFEGWNLDKMKGDITIHISDNTVQAIGMDNSRILRAIEL